MISKIFYSNKIKFLNPTDTIILKKKDAPLVNLVKLCGNNHLSTI